MKIEPGQEVRISRRCSNPAYWDLVGMVYSFSRYAPLPFGVWLYKVGEKFGYVVNFAKDELDAPSNGGQG